MHYYYRTAFLGRTAYYPNLDTKPLFLKEKQGRRVFGKGAEFLLEKDLPPMTSFRTRVRNQQWYVLVYVGGMPMAYAKNEGDLISLFTMDYMLTQRSQEEE